MTPPTRTKTFLALLLAGALLLTGLLPGGAPVAQAQAICDPDGQQASGAVYRICMPEQGWNGDLVVYAHGYVAFNEPIAIPEDQLTIPDGPSIPDMVTGLGYAFATTSYSVNGLAVKEGLADLQDLVAIFTATHGAPHRVYLVGPSEGGLITALGTERYFDTFDGGLAACGPVGDFRRQIDYWGDVRVLFDYFFPGVLPGSPVQIPAQLIDQWDSFYEGQAEAALRADPHAREQLLRTAKIPNDPSDPESGIQATLQLLWYNVFATNDGTAKLGGQPFDNSRRLYFGSDNDLRLNRSVARFQADPAALAEIQRFYQTSGDLTVPVVTLHTLGDEVVPYPHEPLYRAKILAHGDQAQHVNVPSPRFGHCNFSAAEVLASFAILIYKVSGELPLGAESILPDPQLRQRYQDLLREAGLPR